MSSSLLTRLAIAVCLLVPTTGCRDLTMPEPADPIVADLSLFVVGLGDDGPLPGAVVVIDNSGYVDPDFAGSWTAVSAADGIARFPARLRGTYDVTVSSGEEFDTAPGRNTPAWTSYAVNVTDASAVVAYPGLPVEALFDWPELSALGISPGDYSASVSFARSESHSGSQDISNNGSGTLVGVIPWPGEFRVSVRVTSERFSLHRYVPRERLYLDAGSVVSVPSPLQEHTVDVFAGGSPLDIGTINIVHDTAWLSTEPSYRLDHIVDAQGGRVRFFLMEPAISELRIQWVQGPRFLPIRRFLSPENSTPRPIDLGALTVNINIVDESGLPVPGARMQISDGAVNDTWWDAAEEARFVCFLNPASYRLEAWAGATSRSAPVLLELDGDTELTITLLDQEAP